MQNTSKVSGTLEQIRFHKNNFLIGQLNSGISVKGSMIAPQIGMEYQLVGIWEHSARWGDTFKFIDYKASYPKELSGIRAYLMGNCKWIGIEISKRIVNAYGEDTLVVCKSDPDKIAREISGITPQRALEISAMLKDNEANEELQLQLKSIFDGIRISQRAITQVLEQYGQKAPEIIRENPYALIDEIDGIGFLTADQIALKVGFSKEGKPRINAGIIHLLKEKANMCGHTHIPQKLLIEETGKMMDIEKDKIQDVIRDLVIEERLVEYNGSISLRTYYEKERSVVEKLWEILIHHIKGSDNE